MSLPRFLTWYYFTNPKVADVYASPTDLAGAWLPATPPTSPAAAPTDAEAAAKVARAAVKASIEMELQTLLALPDSGFAANRQGVDAGDLLAGLAPGVKVTCVERGTQQAGQGGAHEAKGSPWYANVRIRGTSDALTPAQDEDGFSSAPSAALSYSKNPVSQSESTSLEAAIGYAFQRKAKKPKAGEPEPWWYTAQLIPFVSVDRSIATANGKDSSSNRENVALGVEGNLVTNPQHGFSSEFSATYQHLWNDTDDSRLNYIHLVYKPHMAPVINSYAFWPEHAALKDQTVSASLLVDLRSDFGLYSNRGLAPTTNIDYIQIGGRIGLDVDFPKLKSDITVAQTYMAQADGGRPDIKLFEASWNYQLIDKILGLKASYQSGRLEATGQVTRQWLVSLTAKY